MIPYKVRKKRFDRKGINQAFETAFLAVPVQTAVVDVAELGDRLCHKSSLTRGDVLNAISGLLDEMQHSLFKGETVYLEGIGRFSISATNDPSPTPEEVTPSRVRANRICFRAAHSLRQRLKLAQFRLVK